MANSSAIRIDHFNKKILISKSFQKATMNPNSNEYKELAAVMANHPTYDMQRFYLVQSIKKMLLEEEAARAAASSPEINLTIKSEVK